MPHVLVSASAHIPEPAAKLYRILADYRQHHPKILPPYFEKVEIEQGGYGAGTVIWVYMNTFGFKQSYHMQVTEPEPGRVLVETDLKTGLVTTFTVTPQGAQASEVTISTNWIYRDGLRGWLEKLTTPPMMRRIYRQELQQLAAYARQLA